MGPDESLLQSMCNHLPEQNSHIGSIGRGLPPPRLTGCHEDAHPSGLSVSTHLLQEHPAGHHTCQLCPSHLYYNLLRPTPTKSSYMSSNTQETITKGNWTNNASNMVASMGFKSKSQSMTRTHATNQAHIHEIPRPHSRCTENTTLHLIIVSYSPQLLLPDIISADLLMTHAALLRVAPHAPNGLTMELQPP